MNHPEWNRFLIDHRQRHRFARLPDPTTDDGERFFDVWRKRLAARGIVEVRYLEIASERLLEEPGKARDHFSDLVKYAVEAMAAAGVTPEATAGAESREQAEAASHECGHCGGSGMTVVWHPRGGDREHREPESVAAYCVCRMGRWVRARHVVALADVLKRTPDFADVQLGRSSWLIDPPGLDPALVMQAETFGDCPAELIREWTRNARESGLTVQPTRTSAPSHRPSPESIASDPILKREYQG